MALYAMGMTQATLQLNDDWLHFKSEHHKAYKEQQVDAFRNKIWMGNLALIEKHNREAEQGKHTYTLGMNKFGDWTTEELLRYTGRCHFTSFPSSGPAFTGIGSDVPDEIDWRNHSYVTPVKDQKACGSCYAFAATAALEGQHARATGQLVSLSEQQIVDCSEKFGNLGCKGGNAWRSFDYVIENGGIVSDKQYPYEAKDTYPCRVAGKAIVATCDEWRGVLPQANEAALKQAVGTVGPVSVASYVPRAFYLYKSGVFYDIECLFAKTTGHAVAVVGYGTYRNGSDVQDYWIVRNSWGSQWGEGGYVKMARNRNNHCLIASYATYPAMQSTSASIPNVSVVIGILMILIHITTANA